MRKQGYKITQDGGDLHVSFVMKHEERDAKGARCSGFLGNFEPGTIGRGYSSFHKTDDFRIDSIVSTRTKF